MGNVRKLLLVLRKFTPKGQELVLDTLKQNRKFLSSKEYAFAELPQILSDFGKTKAIEEQLVNPNNSIRDIVISLLKTKKHKSKISSDVFVRTQAQTSNLISNTQIQSLSQNFKGKKQEIIKLLQECSYTKELIKQAEIVKTPREMQIVLNNYFTVIYTNMEKLLSEGVIKEKEFYNLGKTIATTYYKLIKTCCNSQNNQTINRVTQILQKKYGMKFISFCDEESAVNTLKAVKVASKNGHPLPQNIISSSHIQQPLNIVLEDNSIAILLKPKSAYDDIMKLQLDEIKTISGYKYPQVNALLDQLVISSTNNSMGIYLHEILHTGMPNRANYGQDFVDALHNNTLCKHSGYLRGYYIQGAIPKEEARVELEAKRLLERLKPKESIVLDAIS